MIDSIVMYPLDVMPLELGLNVLGLSSPELLFKFVEGLQGFGDDVVLGDGSKTAVLTNQYCMLGIALILLTTMHYSKKRQLRK